MDAFTYIKKIFFSCVVYFWAFTYILAPINEQFFDIAHSLSHEITSITQNSHTHKHTHDFLDNESHVHHHVNDHSHTILSFFSSLLNHSKNKKENLLVNKIDKHILANVYSFEYNFIPITKKAKWFIPSSLLLNAIEVIKPPPKPIYF